ncbi:Hypothetical protein FKW44_012993, partial [Caligus rogercresseyi]
EDELIYRLRFQSCPVAGNNVTPVLNTLSEGVLVAGMHKYRFDWLRAALFRYNWLSPCL